MAAAQHPPAVHGLAAITRDACDRRAGAAAASQLVVIDERHCQAHVGRGLGREMMICPERAEWVGRHEQQHDHRTARRQFHSLTGGRERQRTKP